MNNILLLTSTIKPNSNQPQLKLTNPQERLEDYKKALAFYSKEVELGTVDRIVFVDNSGYDLKCLSESYPSKKIEWISFYGLDYPTSYHRGYGEFALIDYAFENSAVLKAASHDDVIWKVTGRYIIDNLESVIKYGPRQFHLYCDIKKNWVDMGLMGWTSTGYTKFIKGVYRSFKSGMAPELILAKLIKEKAGDGIITSYYWPPFIIGRRGADGGHFQGRLTYLKFTIASCINWLKLPFRRAFAK